MLSGLIAAGALAVAVAENQAQQQPPTVRLDPIEHVRGNLYVIRGSAGNGQSGVFVTDKGVVLIDTKVRGSGPYILDRIRSVTDKPVTMIINTHRHADHTGGNTEFPPTVEIVAHENTKVQLVNDALFKGDNAKFLPKTTFKDKMSLLSGKDQIDLYYFGRGHTNGDIFVVFPAVRAMHMGDLFARKANPFIDVASGGSGLEFSKTLATAVATIKNVDTVITGHATVVHWSDLKEFADFHVGFLKTVQAAMRAGQSVDDFVKTYKYTDIVAGPTEEARYLPRADRSKDYVQAIYDESKKSGFR